ncbi:hypothetical protein KEM56_007788 [Ascosphaera pollenicola]|nr:hypothetical protein KEM56_007788 [Ascosphaera pollenicola]
MSTPGRSMSSTQGSKGATESVVVIRTNVQFNQFNANAAAEQSPYNIRNRGRTPGRRTWGSLFGGGGSSPWFGSGGGGPAGNASGRRRFGTINDVRGPECRSCQ